MSGHIPIRRVSYSYTTIFWRVILMFAVSYVWKNNVQSSYLYGRDTKLCHVVCISGIRKFRWSELKAATNGFSNGNLIGQGGDFIVYKVLQVYNFVMDNLECGELHGKTPLFKTDVLICARFKHLLYSLHSKL
jgi:hypothetical protein